ncbi:metallophosphoesterase [Amycolatopsis rubida]|uniref:Metallophosphoesterase n=1 Tax=Amycolatopsis rubida TaxID=112413 RepID=A0A1I6ADR7_9PSEU|nr:MULTISPECIES: metallophosphoesterase [Amycolatopsis]MYW92314.1 metallophosphoesterase [Amycolatopsis rubida]NEC57302.1 metallophosphoesterase [Amycolatopsis rubida]OAP23823.1 Calcineurin-like phosphoesterase [Amycolatopsis sp. M39]SFQ66819.1 Predicted phosphoesterase [Amycolatopsis rubida]
MPKALVVADEADERLWTSAVRSLRVDLVLAAGDLPFAYLEFLAGMLDVPCVFVPGNHDPDLSGFTRYGGLSMKDGFPTEWPGPAGGVNADGRIVDVAGLRIAGLGGSIRYRDGPNQWTQRQQARRARRLERRFRWRKRRDGNGIDVLLTHSPPRHLGDREDPPHQGFTCLHRTIDTLRPQWLLHGHIHPNGEPVPDRVAGRTRIRNVVGYQVMEFPR